MKPHLDDLKSVSPAAKRVLREGRYRTELRERECRARRLIEAEMAYAAAQNVPQPGWPIERSGTYRQAASPGMEACIGRSWWERWFR